MTSKKKSTKRTGLSGHKRARRRPFPYDQVAKLWAQGKSIAFIARAIGRIDRDNPKDPCHSLRNFLRKMHMGYTDHKGRTVRLPYRVSQSTIRASRKAGLRAA